ncbi:MAG: hypothetical protein V4662_11955 [Verrucomicrobiota bacterium]
MSPLPHPHPHPQAAGAAALLRILQRPLKAELALSSFAALCFMAANPGEHTRLDIMRAVHRTASSRNMYSILGALETRGLASSRKIPGWGRNGQKFLHTITPAGLEFLGVTKPATARSTASASIVGCGPAPEIVTLQELRTLLSAPDRACVKYAVVSREDAITLTQEGLAWSGLRPDPALPADVCEIFHRHTDWRHRIKGLTDA